jgi:adenylate kinase family enzyme
MICAELRPALIHITGASGGGVTTLGAALARRLGRQHLDTDDFYWANVEPKFSVKRPVQERIARLETAFEAAGAHGSVLSGSVSEWADPIVPLFGLVVFISAPVDVRIARLRAREAQAFGVAIAPGNPRHEEHEAFIAWAAAYDSGTQIGRSRARHEAWLAKLACPVLRLDGAMATSELCDAVVEAWERRGPA